MVDEGPRACQAMETGRIPLLYPCRTIDPGLRERRSVMQRLQRAFCAVVLGLAMTAPAFAQLSTARLDGRVTDTSGGVLPGVTVTLTQTETGAVRNAVTDENGGY